MPTNLGHEAITAKLGHADPSMYLGHEQIYPNTTTVTSFAFADTSTVSNAGATRVLNIGGDIGSTFNLTGANGAGSLGAQSLSSASQAFNISIGSNNSYGAAGRSPSVTISPTGNTTLAGGVPTSRTLTQAAGPAVQTVYINAGLTAAVLVNNTTTVNGQLRWAQGAKFRITLAISASNFPWAALSSSSSFTLYHDSFGGSGSGTVTLSNFSQPFTSTNNNNDKYWRPYPTSPSGNIPTGNYQYDMEITNNINPTYVRFSAYAIPSAGYQFSGLGAGVLSHFAGYQSYYP
tara:strand:+ start:1709 stop:2578 length:870 start_codon:yes stop_codon:yes gene_type:complete